MARNSSRTPIWRCFGVSPNLWCVHGGAGQIASLARDAERGFETGFAPFPLRLSGRIGLAWRFVSRALRSDLAKISRSAYSLAAQTRRSLKEKQRTKRARNASPLLPTSFSRPFFLGCFGGMSSALGIRHSVFAFHLPSVFFPSRKFNCVCSLAPRCLWLYPCLPEHRALPRRRGRAVISCQKRNGRPVSVFASAAFGLFDELPRFAGSRLCFERETFCDHSC